ncbi:hypothetical protein Tco_1521878 [Tanacetum coccineum]
MGKSGGSSMAGGSRTSETPEFKRLLRHPSVTTPSKVDEVKKQKGERMKNLMPRPHLLQTHRQHQGWVAVAWTQERTKGVLRMTMLRVRETSSCSILVTAKLMDMGF